MIHAETTAPGHVRSEIEGSREQTLKEAITVMAHMGILIARETGCTPEEAMELLQMVARIQMRDGEPGGEEARLS